MPGLDRHFVVTEDYARKATKAAFVAWHHMSRPWKVYGVCVIVGVVSAQLLGGASYALVAPLLIGTDVVQRYRRIGLSVRQQEPLGTTIALGFGDSTFVYRTWAQSGEVPYAAVTHVITSHGCRVLVALSHHIFWALPAEQIPEAALARMTDA